MPATLWRFRHESAMDQTTLTILLAVLGALGSAALGAWLQHRKDALGYYFRPPRRTRRYVGHAADMRLRDHAVELSDAAVSLDGDFQRLSPRRWDLDYRFAFSGTRLEVTGQARDSDGRSFAVRGRGTLHGTDASGTCFLEVSGAGDAEHGIMIYILKWSNPDTLRGYWIANDSDRLGRLAIGTLRLRREAPSPPAGG